MSASPTTSHIQPVPTVTVTQSMMPTPTATVTTVSAPTMSSSSAPQHDIHTNAEKEVEELCDQLRNMCGCCGDDCQCAKKIDEKTGKMATSCEIDECRRSLGVILCMNKAVRDVLAHRHSCSAGFATAPEDITPTITA